MSLVERTCAISLPFCSDELAIRQSATIFPGNRTFHFLISLSLQRNQLYALIQFSPTLMNIEDFRTYCLSFKGVSEKMPFGKASTEYDRNLLVFSVCDKWFCFVNVDVFDFCNGKHWKSCKMAIRQSHCKQKRPYAFHKFQFSHF